MKQFRITQKVESYEEYFVVAASEAEALEKFNEGEYEDGFHHQESIPVEDPEVSEVTE